MEKALKKTERKLSVGLVYTICFIAVAVMAFGVFVIYGKTLIHNLDGFSQHYPLLVKLRHLVGDFIRGEGISFWVEEIGYGADLIANTVQVIFDPFSYIAAAFPVKYIDIGYGIAVILRLYAAGWAMIAFLRYRKFSKTKCLIGGLSYAFCGWAIGVIRHAFFLNPLILMPLIILGIEKVLAKKSPMVLILSVFGALVTFIYFAYMTAIFVIIYICVRYVVWENEKSVKKFFCMIGRLVGYVMISLCMALPVVLPVLYGIVCADKTSNVNMGIFLNIRQILRCIPSLISYHEINGYFSIINMNALFVLLIPSMLFRIREKEKRVPIIMLFFCLLMACFPLWGRIMNGFSYASGRWFYILEFFFVWAAIEVLDFKRGFSEKEKKASILWIGILALSLIIAKGVVSAITTVNLVIGLCNLVFMLLFYLFYEKHKNFNGIMLGILILNIGGIYFLMNSPMGGDVMAEYLDKGVCYEKYNTSVQKATRELTDEDFYRVDQVEGIHATANNTTTARTPANESVFWESRTLSTYFSSIEGKLLQYNKMLGNNAGYYRRMCMFSNDNRSRLNFLAGIKYFLSSPDASKEEIEAGEVSYSQHAGYGYDTYMELEEYKIMKANHEPGLGYVYQDIMSESELETYSSLEREQILMQKAVVPDEKMTDEFLATIETTEDVQLDIQEIPYTIADYTNVIYEENNIEVQESNQMLGIIIPKVENAELYIQFEGLEKESYTLQELMEMTYPEGTSKYNEMKNYVNNISYEPYAGFGLYVSASGKVKRLINAEESPQGLSDIEEYTANIGYFEEKEGYVTITFSDKGKYHFDSLKIYAVSQENFDEQAEKLSERRFTMTEKENDTIRGTVSTDKDGLLYFSLVYHPGWRVYVDGVLTDTVKTNICFMGVPVEAGTHEVTLVYRPFGFMVGLICCGIGLVAFIGCLIFHYKKGNIAKE